MQHKNIFLIILDYQDWTLDSVTDYIFRAVGGNAEAPFVHIMGEEVSLSIMIKLCPRHFGSVLLITIIYSIAIFV